MDSQIEEKLSKLKATENNLMALKIKLENATANLEQIKAELREQYNTDDLEKIREIYSDLNNEQKKAVAAFENDVDALAVDVASLMERIK